MALFPALDVYNADGELVLAVVDDYSPTAVEEHDGFLSIFFSDPAARDRAREAIVREMPAARVDAREVDDEDWARRSQEALGPVTVGRIIVAPPWAGQLFSTGAGAPPPARSYADASPLPLPGSAWPQALPVSLIIRPSMAFGTGHHATTRLCLVALQMLNLSGTCALDIGTGSGILAIAARLLGADGAFGIDNDPDAVQCARENLTLNPGVDRVRFERGDLLSPRSAEKDGLYVARGLEPLRQADVVTANLTGALLCRAAPALANAFAPGGALIVSGLLADERDEVVAGFQEQELDLVWEMEEEGWVGLGFARLLR